MAAANPLNIYDFEALARSRIDPAAYDYFAGGAGDELTVAENCRAFQRITFRPHVLVDVSVVNPSTHVLGRQLSFPVMLAPTALNRLGHPEGEVAAARAAGAAGTAMVLSTTASSTIEEVAGAATGDLWFQLYVYRDRAVTHHLVRRAEASGYRALVLTVDLPRMGRRERDLRNRLVFSEGVRFRNLETAGPPGAAAWPSDSSFIEYVHNLLDPGIRWESIAWLKSITKLPILIKGVLRDDVPSARSRTARTA